MQIKQGALLFLILIVWANVLWALPLVDKIQEISRAPNLSNEQKVTGKNTLLIVVARCEFDEACLLKQMVPLKELFEKEKNPMYVDFVEYLYKNQDTLEKDSKRCNLDEKKAARKIFAQCFKDMVDKSIQSSSFSTRAIIDHLEDIQDVCIKTNMEPLAKQGNIFAQVVMVNIYQTMSDAKKMDYWYNQIQQQSGTKRYQEFQSCSEIP